MPNPVKETCKELQITQKELAERIGISDGTVRNWSSGKEIPKWAINFMDVLVENEKNKEFSKTFRHLVELSKSNP